jgi:hypothetical protein
MREKGKKMFNNDHTKENMQRKYKYEFLCKRWLFGSKVDFLGQKLTFCWLFQKNAKCK